MAEIADNIIQEARELLSKLTDDGVSPKYGARTVSDLYTDDAVVEILVDELNSACAEAVVALEVLKLQAREIDALRNQVRAYAAGVAEVRIENASLRARLAPEDESEVQS